MLDFMLTRLKQGARIVLCGASIGICFKERDTHERIRSYCYLQWVTRGFIVPYFANECSDDAKPQGLKNYSALIGQRATMEGFIVYAWRSRWCAWLTKECRFDYRSRYAEARQELAKGISNGSIQRKFHIVEGGVQQAPVALPLLFNGGNTGKL